jgi:fermentation-respiration switch protein FrsA (DUF1100 family)
LLGLAACGSSGSGSEDAAPDGPFAVGIRRFTFVDSSRPTRENNGVPAKSSRTLKTAVYYPTAGAPREDEIPDAPVVASSARFPLIAFAHGFTGISDAYRLLLHAWAEAGYVVAAPDFPLSSARAEGGPRADDYVNQPADVSFVITQMLALTGVQAGGLDSLIDSQRIGASGQSLGAITTLGVAFNTCCVDPRISAAISLAGRTDPYPGGEYFTGIHTPILLVHGDVDDQLPYAGSVDAFARANPPKFLVTIVGGDHIIPYIAVGLSPLGEPTLQASIAFFDHYLKHERGSLDRLLAVGSLERGRIQSQLD